MYSRIYKSSSWDLPVQAKSTPFAPRPWGPQPQESDQLPTQTEQAQAQPNYLEILIRNAQTSDTPQSGTPVQAKLSIGAPGNKYEQEADRVAAQVVQQINAPQTAGQSIQRQDLPDEEEVQMKPLLQRESLPDEEDEVQMKSTQDEAIAEGDASVELESTIHKARGSGQALDSSLQRRIGKAMGADFSGVKVHTDAQADQLNRSIQAKAFTTGQDIFFRQGAYEPGNPEGQELIAHELTHVVQQNGEVVQRKTLLPTMNSHNQRSEMQLSQVSPNLIQPMRIQGVGNTWREFDNNHIVPNATEQAAVAVWKNRSRKNNSTVIKRQSFIDAVSNNAQQLKDDAQQRKLTEIVVPQGDVKIVRTIQNPTRHQRAYQVDDSQSVKIKASIDRRNPNLVFIFHLDETHVSLNAIDNPTGFPALR